jgi:hypothetical protein
MPAHNFMLDDLAGSLRAIALFPLFAVMPGYAIAWWADLLDFRRRTAAFRICAAVPLSLAFCPILTYLAGRVSMAAVWALYAVLSIAFAAALARGKRSGSWAIPREWWPFAAAIVLWSAVAVFSLIDIQVGQRLYYPVSSIDTSVRSSFVHALSTDGIPPQNPFFFPGRPVALRYHYFWLMLCSLVERTGGGSITPRQAIAGGTVWCGIGLLALVALYLRLFCAEGRQGLRRRMGIALALAAVTGLDIIPSALLAAAYFTGRLKFLLPSVEWWNEHVDWFVYSAIWAPHALASMIACLTAFLLLWTGAARRRHWVAAGAAMASAAGASIYVGFVFAVFLAVWMAICAWKRWFPEVRALLAAGTVGAVLVLPYAAALLHSAAPVSGGGPLQFTVREFSLAPILSLATGITGVWRLVFINGPLIPLNYLLELGVFFAAAGLWWRKRRGSAFSRQELACVAMAGTSIAVCTFLRSSVIGCNDLGWRGFLIAEFILLLIGVEVFSERTALARADRALLTVFFVLGAAGTVCDLALTRTFPILADAGVMPPLDWMSPDRHYGERTYASRAAYEWIRVATPQAAAVQFNPKVAMQDTAEMLYASRRTVAADLTCNAAFGGSAADCVPIIDRLKSLYAPGGELRDACSALPVNIVIAKDTDAAWRDRDSWVWREPAVFANAYVRLFACPPSSRSLRYSMAYSKQ